MSDITALKALLGGPLNACPLWGSFIIVGPPDVFISWGIWIGSFLLLVVGALGLIGGAML